MHKKPGGMKYVAEGFDPHILDVTRRAAKIWDAVSDTTVIFFWVKGDTLPKIFQADLKNEWSKMKTVTKDMAVQEMLEGLGAITLH